MRITPSQVVAYIRETWASANLEENARAIGPLMHGEQIVTASLLALTDGVGSEFLTVPQPDQAQFFIARTAIKTALESWGNGHISINIGPTAALRGRHPVWVIYDVLKRCSDEAASPQAPDLKFIADQELRELLRLDLSSATRAMSNGEWKATTVLAGSIIEALLLWKLKDDMGAANTSAQFLVREGILTNKPNSQLDRWGLHELIEVAAHRRLISGTTAVSARLTKDFRNLIHPGKAIRSGLKATLGGAHVALGALDFVIQDLS